MQQRILVYLMSILIPMNIAGQELHWNDTVTAENQILRTHILFEYNSDSLLPESIPLLDSLSDFILRNENWVFEIGVHNDTRSNVKASISMTQVRAERIKKELLKLGIPDYNIKSKGYEGIAPLIAKGKISTMSLSDQEKAHAMNRRTELKAVGKFSTPDWKKYTIPPDLNLKVEPPRIGEAKRVSGGYDRHLNPEDQDPVWKDLIAWLRNNPGSCIEITYHTDHRGDYRYNQDLSERRAESIHLYLASLGANASQYTCAGFGESMSIIPEEDIVKMSPPNQEKAHLINLRVQVKFLKI